MEYTVNDFATTLGAAIVSAVITTITVVSSTGAPTARFRIRVGDELMLVTAVSHPTWTVTRGVEGSTATTHLIGTDVAHVLSKGGLDQYLKEFGPVAINPIVETGGIRTIPSGMQLMVPNGLVVDGELRVEGEVYV
jgi:hypothetical protein